MDYPQIIMNNNLQGLIAEEREFVKAENPRRTLNEMSCIYFSKILFM